MTRGEEDRLKREHKSKRSKRKRNNASRAKHKRKWRDGEFK